LSPGLPGGPLDVVAVRPPMMSLTATTSRLNGPKWCS
jgi:hypothetical protein